MEAVLDFLAMGGYASFVWPAFAVTAVVMLFLLLASLQSLRANQAALERLEAERASRRPKRGAAARAEGEVAKPEAAP
jgi:heme exporter protein D